jgi:uncharacterized membrane protein
MIRDGIKRYLAVDTLRGFAIVVMILSNLAGEHLAEPHPMGLRIVGSVAAPIFIALCGMMLGFAKEKKDVGFGYFLKRSLKLFGVALAIDLVVWRAVPFLYVDVLHLLGVGILAMYTVLKLPRVFQWMIALGILVVSPYLQQTLGYIAVPTFIELFHFTPLPSIGVLVKHWIVDGWFPLFPWLSCLIFGANLVPLKRRYDALSFDRKLWVRIGSFLVFIATLVYWRMYPGVQIIRDGYSELFYPPTIGFMVCMMAMIVVLLVSLESVSSLRILRPFQVLGQHSLVIYAVHLAMMVYLMPEGQKLPFPLFVVVYLTMMVVILLGVYVHRELTRTDLESDD